MVKVTVLYGAPEDPAAFEDDYASRHLPLVAKMPGLRRFEHGRIVATRDGSPPPYYRMAELWYDGEAELQAAMGSPEGRATAEDAAELATGGLTILISEVAGLD
jgi:uncharacterized protein (TIGR02118 family)